MQQLRNTCLQFLENRLLHLAPAPLPQLMHVWGTEELQPEAQGCPSGLKPILCVTYFTRFWNSSATNCKAIRGRRHQDTSGSWEDLKGGEGDSPLNETGQVCGNLS